MAGGWKASLAAVLKLNNGRKASGGSTSGFKTQAKRAEILYSSFELLHRELGYKLSDVREFRGRHVKALAAAWEKKGYSASTLQNRLSTLRVFSQWIGKQGLVESSDTYFSRPGAAQRSGIAKTDKSWSAHGVDRAAVIAAVAAKDPRIALQLELQAAFNLRAQESWLLRPHMDDKGSYLSVVHGTKGGRDRVVPIDTQAKREVLDRAKTFAEKKWSSTSDPTKSLSQVKNHYYDVVRDCGIKREGGLGVTSHGLRAQYAGDKFQKLTGVPCPVRGGGPVDPDSDRAARLELAEELGHSRTSITRAYIG
jgi:integrase